MKDGRHIIWSNDIDYDDWREELEEQYPDLTEAERMELMYELNGRLFGRRALQSEHSALPTHSRCQ